MKNRIINIGVVEEVAMALGSLKSQMVFVGGAVVSLYANDPVADEIRPTSDIDMTVNLVNYSNWSQLEEKLGQLNIHPDPFGHSICSYRYKDIPLDIIPANASHVGESNRWYNYGFEDLWIVRANAVEINILPVSCYLAAKFDAFNDRGKDYRTSHDFEDIIYVIDNRIEIVEDIKHGHADVIHFLKQELSKAINNAYWEDILMAHIHPLLLEERGSLLTDKIKQILTF